MECIYASSQGIKAPRETSNGWMDVSSCIFLLSARCVGEERVCASGNQAGFTQLHPAPAGCLHSPADYRSQLGFYCVSLPTAFLPSKHSKPLTSPPAGTLVHNCTVSVEFFGLTSHLLTQTGTSNSFPLFILSGDTIKLQESSFIRSFFFKSRTLMDKGKNRRGEV